MSSARTPAGSGSGRPVRSLVDGIDHVYVPMVDASGAYTALTEDLGLPVMWPFTSFGEFASGGVSVGGIKLEVIEANETAPWCTANDPPQVQGIAFRPARSIDAAYLAEVDARALPRSAPEPHPAEGEPRWVNVYFSDMIGDGAGAFVCDYHAPEPRDIERRRRVLAACGGGRLGVLDAVELVIGTQDLDAAQRRWQRLFDPLPPAQDAAWRPEIGPAVRLTPGGRERVEHLTLAVRSAEDARAVWDQVSDGPLRGFPLELVTPSF